MVVITTGKKKIALDDSLDGVNPYDQVNWQKRNARIIGEKGDIAFEQKDVEFPDYFSQLAINVTTSRFMYGELGTPERETSFRTLVDRISSTYGHQAVAQGYMDQQNAERLRLKTAEILIHQKAAFNSPVWFNVGTDRYASRKSNKRRKLHVWHNGKVRQVAKGQDHKWPQSSACFIQGVEDDMDDIMRLATSEAMLFKYGSGTGTDLSTLRSSKEKLSGGGKPSGPLSFMRVYDQIASVVKSGGKTRRAAKMQSLKIDHPDIAEFIDAKMKQEDVMRALIVQGYTPEVAEQNAHFQNVNFSVRVTDDFMEAFLANRNWQTRPVVPVGEAELAQMDLPCYNAKKLLMRLAESAWNCGDPGIQFDTTINRWHTCPNSGRINASNPCSEYMFVDDSSCNLASVNVMRFRRADGSYDIQDLEDTVEPIVVDMDLNYDFSCFPTPEIAANSHRFRPLGMGYSNLGALIMASGLAYDSDAARALTGSLTALLAGKVYETSTKLAEEVGPFEAYDENKDAMLEVMERHRAKLDEINVESLSEKHKPIYERARQVWDEVIKRGRKYGFRNAQGVVIAPTGTISFEMDCDTTGIEAETSLVKIKELAGGGLLRIVNQTVPLALEKLGYEKDQITDIVQYVGGHEDLTQAPHLKAEHYDQVRESNAKSKTLEELGYSGNQLEEMVLYLEGHGTIEGAPHLKDEHLPVFDCAYTAPRGKRCLSWKAHVDMMAAAQPFVSGAISKTVAMPNESTPEDIADAYVYAWEKGLKALAVYRDGSKTRQVLRTTGKAKARRVEKLVSPAPAIRVRLLHTRKGTIHKYTIGQEHDTYVTVGHYPDGKPGELFIEMAKEGSTAGGFAAAFGTAISMLLQVGYPLENLVNKFSGMDFEPRGWVTEGERKKIRWAKSHIDYIFRWLGHTYIPGFQQMPTPENGDFESGSQIVPVQKPSLLVPAQALLDDSDGTSLVGESRNAQPRGIKSDKSCRVCHSDSATYQLGGCMTFCDPNFGGCGTPDATECGGG